MQKLNVVEALVETDYQGSRVFKDINLLIMAGDLLDKDGRGFLLLPNEAEPIVHEPFLRVVETPERYMISF